MGALTTALFFFYMIAAPLTGWLGDRFPRKPLIIAGAVLWSLATLATAWVHDYTTLYIRHALVGVGEATFGIFAPAVLADFYPERERNRILSIFYLAIPVGAALGYLAGGQMGPLWGWRAPFLSAPFPASSSPPSMDGWAANPSAAPATTSAPRSIAPPSADSSPTPPTSPLPSAWPLSPSPWAASPTGFPSSCAAPPGFQLAAPARSSARLPSSTASPEPSPAAGSPSAGCAPITAPSTWSLSGASPSHCPAACWSSLALQPGPFPRSLPPSSSSSSTPARSTPRS